MKESCCQVGLGNRSYDILFAKVGSPEAQKQIADVFPVEKMLAVLDSNVARLDRAEACCRMLGAEPYVFPAGEGHKTPDEVINICRMAAVRQFSRKCGFVAIGGGVVGDMTGFAAGIFMRGIPFLQVPTTLLAMVDSSVGGKTGCDLIEGKNLVGLFNQPKLVLIDRDFLLTLPEPELRCGLAEVVKYGVILDRALFELLEQNLDKLLTRDLDFYEEVIFRCCQIKAGVVMRDETEQGERMLLNYGHTFGHAVELLSHFAVPHGEAVAMGMAAAGAFALQKGLWTDEELERQNALLAALGLPDAMPPQAMSKAIVECMRHDKKNSFGHIALVLPEALGRGRVLPDAAPEEIEASLDGVR
ncbi:MAG: 3-dehydroquinate synthase [Victivallaceae bacterium]|nr:3-dehydroquinate synthase [Victivallaceae bacterium]